MAYRAPSAEVMRPKLENETEKEWNCAKLFLAARS